MFKYDLTLLVYDQYLFNNCKHHYPVFNINYKYEVVLSLRDF